MRWTTSILGVAALISSAVCQEDDTPVKTTDAQGRSFLTYNVPEAGISYGVAIAADAGDKFDTIVKITAPANIGWVGLAWGGGMTYNPLAIMWKNGDKAMISSRMAFGYFAPPLFPDTTYTLLEGSGANATHISVTALCKGCSYWAPFGADPTSLDPKGENYLAFAFSQVPVDEPNNPETTFGIHDRVGHWIHDFSKAQSADFAKWAGDAGKAPAASPAPTPTSSPATTMTTITTTTASAAPTNSAAPPALALPTACAGVAAPRFPVEAAEGWTAVKLRGNMSLPRQVVVDPRGNLLVVESRKGLTAHTMGKDGCIASSKTVLDNPALNHGLSLAPDGKTLYVSSIATAWRYTYDAETQSVSGETIVIKGMYPGGHPSRALLVPPATPDLLVVQLGSLNNFDMPSLEKETARAVVKVFNMSSVPAGGWDYNTQGWFFGYGLRNEVALVADGNNMVWGLENSGDDFTRTAEGRITDVHIDNPAEELNYLGDPSKPNENWYGYPVCFTIWEPQLFIDKKFVVGEQFVVAPNTTYNDTNCLREAIPPRLSLQAHSAPIDAKFDANFTNMYVTLHGSWNRAPPTGYKVVQIPFTKNQDGTYEPAAKADSKTGYTDILTSKNIESCDGRSCIRPSGLAWDAGFTRMYLGSDNQAEGELFVLYKTPA